MTTFLKNVPGGPEFIERCVNAAAEASLAFAGQPDDRVRASLEKSRENLTRDLAEYLGAENAQLVADEFVKAVLRRKSDIEALNTPGHVQ